MKIAPRMTAKGVKIETIRVKVSLICGAKSELAPQTGAICVKVAIEQVFRAIAFSG